MRYAKQSSLQTTISYYSDLGWVLQSAVKQKSLIRIDFSCQGQ